MASIYPITTRRVSDLLIQQRLLAQFDNNRNELVRIQDQLSSGYRISIPSQDPPAAQRGIALQRILEQKDQARSNLHISRSFVDATESALNGISELLVDIRAQSLTALDTTTGESERQVLIAQIDQTLEQLLNAANTEFRGRYLFAGSTTTVKPYETEGSLIVYRGNDESLESLVDLEHLARNNLTGQEAFGGVSAEVRGTIDLNPVLTMDTKLADLRNGEGITLGTFIVSDGATEATVDITQAETVGDVVDLLTANAPAGRQLGVRVTTTGLWIGIDAVGGGDLTIRDVDGGTTAAELGIAREPGSGVAPIVGTDLDPQVTGHTRLADILGTRARGFLSSPGEHNDIVIEALANGTNANGVQVRFISNLATGDQALVNYDPVGKTLDIDIQPNVTRASTVVDAINASGLFAASLDTQWDSGNNGSGVVDVNATTTLADGSGTALDQTSGFQIASKGNVYHVAIDGAVTVEDLLNRIEESGADVLARISDDGRRLEVRSRVSGSDFAIGENGGSAATDLGLRSFTRDTPLADLNYGRGVTTRTGTDFTIHRRDGVDLDIDLSSAQTVGDVLDAINSHPANVTNPVTARLADMGNGIVLDDANAAGPDDLTVLRGDGVAAWDLGLVPRDMDQITASPSPSTQTIQGTDVNPIETAGIFTSLIRLKDALAAKDAGEIQRAIQMMDEDFERINYSRAELGTRARMLDSVDQRLAAERVQLESVLSEEVDVDMAESVSNLALQQATMEASLRMIGRTLQMTLLNFI